ncbi:sulfhydryl oxidase 2 [Spea bombifrons]|uniref:sulfhydryl oxidase 2 n=1 Tax=Spea bombifrons TaxID=233779 RepID=UPI002349EB10|nr:sulfhydryl oxidase 2 [Spea bombifrons]
MAVYDGAPVRLLLLLLGVAAWPLRAARLYSPQDPLTVLDESSVSAALNGSPAAWLLEFYSSWCGHCINYAPTWRALAADIKDWEPVIRIGVLDCADEVNFEVCKKYNVQFYPTFRFFKAFTKEFTQGEKALGGSDREVDAIHQMIIDFLQSSPPENKPAACPSLDPINSNQILALFTQKEQHYTAIILETAASYVGRKVMLDLVQYDNLAVTRLLDSDKAVLGDPGVVSVPSCYLIHPNGSRGFINIPDPSRSQISDYLKSLPGVRKKLSLPTVSPTKAAKEQEAGRDPWKDFDKSKTYMADLESGLHYLLRVELATHQTLEGEKLKTFKDLITVLYKLFPGRPHVVKLLETLRDWLVTMPLDKIPYDAILDLVNNRMRMSGIYLTNRIQWVGCRGSRPELRGYPCSLWKLFHTLTVQASTQPNALANTAFAGDSLAVLQTMRRYIKEFFGCRECAQHFEAMARELGDGIKSPDEAVLWLWRKHNAVNKRLAGAPSEDAQSPKVQWPTPDLCPDCREEAKGDDGWQEPKVLAFLKLHYGGPNILLNYSDPNTEQTERQDGDANADPPTARPGEGVKPRDQNPQNGLILKPDHLDKLIQPEGGKNGGSAPRGGNQSHSFLGLGFSNIDMSLCVVLYITSMLFLMLMYLFFRVRSRRWRFRYSRPHV